MKTMPARLQTILSFLVLATMPGLPAMAEIKVTAARTVTVQPTGPRQGDNGRRYFDIEGVRNENYASCGVLVFELPKGGEKAGEVKTMDLRLVQSAARFSKGPILSRRAGRWRDGSTGAIEAGGKAPGGGTMW